MLSVFFSSDDFPDQPTAIEALGWDDLRGRYNYYKMDGSGTPTLQKTWKLRSSSIDADLLSATDRSNTCLACHINGAPIMKELVFPWNNWHSDASGSPAQYLSGPDAWPVADHRRLRNSGGGSGLADAQELEQMIIPSIRNFNTRRLNQALERRSDDGNIRLRDGRMRIVDGRRLLRHLFHTTEVNLISARRKSGLHPIGEALTSGPSTEVIIPNSFFLNAALITGGGIHGYQGLQIPEANAFEFFAKIQPQEYIALVRDRGLIIAGRPGDADFAWFGVEPSHIDNEMVDRLLRRGVMTPQFVAAALTIDLESPVFSDRRAALFRFMPDAWEFRDPLVETTSHPDELTQLVISRLEAEAPSEGTPEREYLTLLKAPDPVAILREKVIAYADRIQTQLASGGSVREAEVARLFDILIARRRQMLDPKEPLNVLDETRDRLFPHQP
jgi:hypothetical protein